MAIVQDWWDRMCHGTVYFMAAVADQVTHWGISGATGMPSKRMDHQFHASAADRYVEISAARDELGLRGPMRFTRGNCLSRRYELKWVAPGLKGKPGINADITNASEAVSAVADPTFEILGTNATSALSTMYTEGGSLLTTAGAANDQMILCPHLLTALSPWTGALWGTDDQTEWECLIETTSTITTMIIWAGLKLTNTSTTATDADQVFFRFQPSVSAFWQTTYGIGAVQTTADTTVTVAASTIYHLKIMIDASRIAKFYINGTLVATSTALTNTDLIPYIGVQGTTGARAVRIFGAAISKAIA